MTNGPSAGLKNTASEYGAVTKFLHWAIFVLFMHQFVVGFVMTVISEDGSAFGQSREWLFEEHKSIGMVVLLPGGRPHRLEKGCASAGLVGPRSASAGAGSNIDWSSSCIS